MAATSITRRREKVGKRVDIFSPEIPSRIAAPVRRPSNSSERDVSFAHEGFECPGRAGRRHRSRHRRRRPHRASHPHNGKEGENPATKGRHGPSVLERAPLIYLEPRYGKEEEKKEGRKRDEWLNEIRASASRRSQVENVIGPEKKKSIPMSLAPGGGAKYICTMRRGCRRLPLQRRTGAQMIIRRHSNARPIARPDALYAWIFSFLSLTPCPCPGPLQPPFKRSSPDSSPSSLPSRRFEAERMALVKSCFLPFEDLRPGALATLEADRENSTMRGHGSNETMHHLRFDRRVFCAVREKRRWKNLSCHSSPERKKKSMQPMSLSNGNEERFENGLANAPQNMYTYICLTRRRGVPREPPSDDCDTATDLHCPPTALV